MAVSKTMEEAIQQQDLGKIYSSFYTILLSDPGFATNKFDEAFSYVKGKNINGFIQPHDGLPFADENDWNQQYWDKVASELMDNFSLERIAHLKQVACKIYPQVKKEEEKTAQKKTQLMPAATSQPRSNTGRLIGLMVVIVIILIIILVLTI